MLIEVTNTYVHRRSFFLWKFHTCMQCILTILIPHSFLPTLTEYPPANSPQLHVLFFIWCICVKPTEAINGCLYMKHRHPWGTGNRPMTTLMKNGDSSFYSSPQLPVAPWLIVEPWKLPSASLNFSLSHALNFGFFICWLIFCGGCFVLDKVSL